MTIKGIIAAGHEKTAEAARVILEEGGNAFDAILAASFAASVAEPVLCSLGGGGFLMAHTADGHDTLYDFFVHTPVQRPTPDALDFYPILADFGTVTQEFHIGMGAIATPGVIKGVFEVHRDLGRMPMQRIVEPAATMAQEGIPITPFERYLFDVVEPIYSSTEGARRLFGSRRRPGELVQESEVLRMPELADTLVALAEAGEALFYRGEIAQRIVRDSREGGGCLTTEDLEGYQAARREPMAVTYREAQLLTNPPPSCGGILIAFTLGLLEGINIHELGFGTAEYLAGLAEAMGLTNKARMEQMAAGTDATGMARSLFEPALLETYRRQVMGRPESLRGTTHINVIDAEGNVASMTISNGEGCGHVIPGTGIMLNNMLGEQDLSPWGFHRWEPNQRMSSMMSPSVMLQPDGTIVATGSGGSNRIRTAILQVLLNLIDFQMPLQEAVSGPRIHFEEGLLSVEGGFRHEEVARLVKGFDNTKVWQERNLFFGGAHSACYHPQGPTFEGAADPRRLGVCLVA